MKTLIHFNCKYWMSLFWAMLIVAAAFMQSCKEDAIPVATTSDVLIASYLSQNPNYSQFYHILDTTKYEGFLNAYGVYTCFAPTNEAITAYVQSKGKSSWHDFTMAELKDIVKFHVVGDSITTSQFTDGKMSATTMYGQYLTSGFSSTGGVSVAFVKGRNGNIATVVNPNVSLGNGILHGIGKVLEPSDSSAILQLKSISKFSIFYAALVQAGLTNGSTGVLDTIKSCTILAETNDVLNAKGIYSINDLKALYKSTGTRDTTDKLYTYASIHCLKGLNFLADIAKNDTSTTGRNIYETLKSEETLTLKRLSDGSIILVTDKNSSGPTKWIVLNDLQSNFKASNGVIHVLNEHYFPAVKKPQPIYWAVTEQPEIMANPNYLKYLYSNSGTSWFEITKLKNVTWTDNTSIFYIPYGTSGSSTDTHPKLFEHGDFLNILMRTAVVKTITFKTPEIVKGKYKIWVCASQHYLSTEKISATFDTIAMPNIINTAYTVPNAYVESKISSSTWDANATTLEGMGVKFYTSPSHQEFVGMLLGTVDVKTTGIHTITFTAQNDGSYGANIGIFTNSSTGASTAKTMWSLDMIHFIPVDWPSQIWPRFDGAGKEVYTY